MDTGFLSLPMTAGRRDIAVAEDDAGNPVYMTPFGQRYTIRRQNPTQGSRVKAGLGVLKEASKAPLESLTAAAQAMAQGAWQGISAPGRAAAGESMTYGDVAGTAMDWGLMNAPGLAFGKYDPASVGIFGGVNAKTADKAALARAQDMAAKGASRDDIWTETGWFAGPDGKWRFEIDDSGATWKRGTIDEKALKRRKTLDRSLNHDDMFSAYPDVGKIPLRPGYGESSNVAGSLADDGAIYINRTGPAWSDNNQFNSTALHEIQHDIQGREGFAAGGSPSDFVADDLIPLIEEADAQEDMFLGASWRAKTPEERAALRQQSEEAGRRKADLRRQAAEYRFGQYRNLAGEAEARNVEARRHMTASERRATPPWNTLDVPEEELIVRGLDAWRR